MIDFFIFSSISKIYLFFFFKFTIITPKHRYAFITFDAEKDGEDAKKEMNGKEIKGKKKKPYTFSFSPLLRARK